MVVAHVLVDGECDFGAFAAFDDVSGFGEVHTEGFLGENAADVFVFENVEDDFVLFIGGDGDVDDLDVFVFEHLLVGCVDVGYLVAVCNGLCVFAGA